jgi:hypothetical protein
VTFFTVAHFWVHRYINGQQGSMAYSLPALNSGRRIQTGVLYGRDTWATMPHTVRLQVEDMRLYGTSVATSFLAPGRSVLSHLTAHSTGPLGAGGWAIRTTKRLVRLCSSGHATETLSSAQNLVKQRRECRLWQTVNNLVVLSRLNSATGTTDGADGNDCI